MEKEGFSDILQMRCFYYKPIPAHVEADKMREKLHDKDQLKKKKGNSSVGLSSRLVASVCQQQRSHSASHWVTS